MNNSEKVDMLLIFGECNRNSRQAAELYAQRYPERYQPAHNYVLRIVESLRNKGSLPGVRHRERPGNVNNEETEIRVLGSFRVNPRSSIRCVAQEVGVSVGVVHKIMKKHKMFPYKVDLVQHLRPQDPDRRLTFIAWLLEKRHDNPSFLDTILWTDESKFTNNGVINKQNNRYWSDVNPHWAMETNNQTVWGTNVWCGLIGNQLLGPYFYDGNLTAVMYLEFLQNVLQEFLEDLPLLLRQSLYFQQDGAPAHNGIIVRNYLRETFNRRWIGTHGPVQWPPRSPDITPLDFFLWGHLKTVVYKNPPLNLDDLKNKINLACNALLPNQIKKATNDELLRRLETCLQQNGSNFEQFIR